MPRSGLDAICSPSSIAIVGASRHRGKIGYEILHNLVVNEYQGTVYPVNPKATSIHGVRAYPSVLEIPDRVDLAIITVPADVALEAVEDCGKKGVRGLVVITAGFREVGEVGMAREARLLAVCDAYDMTMIGPNCMGVINTHPDLRRDAKFAPTPPLPGGISLATQSGALGIAILDHAKSLGVGFAKFCSLGNKAQVSLNDLLRMWHGDPDTKLILAYIENFGNPRNFVRIARETTKDKPVIAVKSGRSEAGSRAAVSHTGSLGGSDPAAEAVFSQPGGRPRRRRRRRRHRDLRAARPGGRGRCRPRNLADGPEIPEAGPVQFPWASRRQRGFRRARDASRAFVFVPGERGAGPRRDAPLCPIPGTRGRGTSNVPRRSRRGRIRVGAGPRAESTLVARGRGEPLPRGVRNSHGQDSVRPLHRRAVQSGGGNRKSRRPENGRPDAGSQVRDASGPSRRARERGPAGGRVTHHRPLTQPRSRP